MEVDDKYVTIVFKSGRADYWFDLDRCDTHEKLVCWVLHLSEKNWFDIKTMRQLIIGVCGQCDLKKYGI